MLRGLYTAATGMMVQLDRQDVIANNLANVNTAGFKRTSVGTSAFDVAMSNAAPGKPSTPEPLMIPFAVLNQDQRPGPILDGKEGSNVNAVEEMVNMITAMRSYESCQRMISSLDQVLDKAINGMGRTA